MKKRKLVAMTTVALAIAVACGGSDDNGSGTGDGDGDGDGDLTGDGDGDMTGGDGDGDGDMSGDGDGDMSGDGDMANGGAGGAGGSGSMDPMDPMDPLLDMTCDELAAEADAALEAAQSCELQTRPPQRELCSTSVQTLCNCPVPVAVAASEETRHYEAVAAAFAGKGCTTACPAVECLRFDGGQCSMGREPSCVVGDRIGPIDQVDRR